MQLGFELKPIITDALVSAVNILISAAKTELKGQGHTLTGSLNNSFRFTITTLGDAIEASVYVADYAMILDKGVKKSRIPYGGRRKKSGAKTSKFIEALVGYWQKRGLSQAMAKRAAFATARKQKREGMPTRNSYSYSNNNRRKDWTKQALKSSKKDIMKALLIVKAFQGQLNMALNRTR